MGGGVLQQDESEPERWSFLQPGVVIYYIGGNKIGEAVFVNIHEDSIICYEEE